MKKTLLLAIFLINIAFFWQFFFKGLLPIPSDTIIGLYHPYRDLYSKDYPNGIPFKNFLTTDPVRQQYPWRLLSLESLKEFEFPTWNPYNLSGTPLLANHQSASFYPLNFVFLLAPFQLSWSFLIFLQSLLASIFLFLYLVNLRLNKFASSLGAVTFSLSGFFISWFEWNTILHTALWLPLILLCVHKLFAAKNRNLAIVWSLAFGASLACSFLAGHLQTFFYLFIFVSLYTFALIYKKRSHKNIAYLFFGVLLFLLFSFVQLFPTMQLIFESAREIDQNPLLNPGWFIPWEHLIQFIAPDFFGNPTTLNYFGKWNYGEFVGYVGIAPLILAIFALFFRKDRKTLFYGSIFFLSLTLSLPTFLSKIPYLLNVPLLSTAQPTRLIFIVDFCLSVLCALGFDYFLKSKEKTKFFYVLGSIGFLFFLIWGFLVFGNDLLKILKPEDGLVARRNMIFPTASFFLLAVSVVIYVFFHERRQARYLIIFLIFFITLVELFRFGWKYTPFTKNEYLYPSTKTINFLNQNLGTHRVLSTDSRILPPNFSIVHKLQGVDGYDPLYLRRYGEFIAASERGEPNIDPPFGYNRIITPKNHSSSLIDFLGVKYVLSLSDLKDEKLEKVFEEGQTKIYENKNVFPRVYLVEDVNRVGNKKEAVRKMFEVDLKKSAVVEGSVNKTKFSPGEAKIKSYRDTEVIINTNAAGEGFLVLTDSFYPTWKALIDGKETHLYITNLNFRGIIVPEGEHEIIFRNSFL